MIPIVEDYLSDILESRFSYLRANPGSIKDILGTNNPNINRLGELITRQPIKITMGYPRTPAELPCVCILLSSEEESQEGLGDYGDEINITTLQHSEILTVQEDSSGVFIKTSHYPVEDINILSNLSTNTDYYDIYPDIPDIGRVQLPAGEVEPGDSISISYSYRNSFEETLRVLYEADYRLEVWSLNGDMTVQLYHLVKWALLTGRDSLVHENLLFRQKLGGADFQPAPNYFPEFVYRRALTFWCQFNASVSTNKSDYILDVSVEGKTYELGGDLDG